MRAARARKLLHLESFTLSWAGEGREETRPPAGPGAARGRQEGRGPISPSGCCQSPPQRSLDLWRRWTDLARDGRTRAGAGGREPESVLLAVLPPGRVRAAPGRARRCPAESLAGQRAGGKGRRESAAGGRTSARLGPAAGDPRLSPPAAPGALCDQMRSPAEGGSQMRDDS